MAEAVDWAGLKRLEDDYRGAAHLCRSCDACDARDLFETQLRLEWPALLAAHEALVRERDTLKAKLDAFERGRQAALQVVADAEKAREAFAAEEAARVAALEGQA